MTVREGLIVILPEGDGAQPQWMRIIDDTVVQSGAGTHWLDACGLSALPAGCVAMLVPPAGLTTLHWIAYPDMPVRQGRAAARLQALTASIGPADALLAATDENDDPSRSHIVAVVARADMQHWLLWAQHHGLDPDIVTPAALLLPAPEEGLARGDVGGSTLLRGKEFALHADDILSSVLSDDATVMAVSADAINHAAIAALEHPTLNLRQGDFAKRTRHAPDKRQLIRLAIWCGFIALASLIIALVAIMRYNGAAGQLDEESLALARTVLPAADDPERVEADLDARLAERGAGAYTFTGPAAGLFTAMQGAPTVALTRLGRSADGMVSATLASARAEDINVVLLALQAAGFAITATSSQDSSGRVIAEITVRT